MPASLTMRSDQIRSIVSLQKDRILHVTQLYLFISEIPASEKFGFCLNTLLSDISVCCPEYHEEILTSQVEVLGALTDIVIKSKGSSSIPPVTLCTVTVPLLLGISRAVGRYAAANDPPLLCRLFPRPAKPQIKSSDPNNQINLNNSLKNSYYTNFRSIIPRSMSGSLNVDCMEAKTITDKHDIRKSKLISFYSVPYDPTTHFFTKFGSSFNQFPNMRTHEHYADTEIEKTIKKSMEKVSFPVNHLQRIFNLSKNLLTKELLQHLDEQAEDIFQLNLHSNSSRTYGYKSFSETISLVIVTLLREILQNQNGIHLSFSFFIKFFIFNLSS